MSNTTRNDIKQIAATIENLAKQFQNNLETGGDILVTANELARNSQTFVFTLGEFYALQQVGSTKAVTGTVVSNPRNTANYHNLRDSRGRFVRKV